MTDAQNQSRILILTAVEGEREAVLRGVGGNGQFDVVAVGVGPALAAVRTALALAGGRYSLVVNAGIAGGFPGRAEVGSLVVATEIVAADLGAESDEGFQSVDELGFGSARVVVDTERAQRLTEALRAANLPVHAGPVLTLATITGTAEKAATLAARVPGATAEAMEGYGVAIAAREHGLPVLELRAISNPVGPRDRGAWKIQEALAQLEAASAVVAEVLS